MVVFSFVYQKVNNYSSKLPPVYGLNRWLPVFGFIDERSDCKKSLDEAVRNVVYFSPHFS